MCSHLVVAQLSALSNFAARESDDATRAIQAVRTTPCGAGGGAGDFGQRRDVLGGAGVGRGVPPQRRFPICWWRDSIGGWRSSGMATAVAVLPPRSQERLVGLPGGYVTPPVVITGRDGPAGEGVPEPRRIGITSTRWKSWRRRSSAPGGQRGAAGAADGPTDRGASNTVTPLSL